MALTVSESKPRTGRPLRRRLRRRMRVLFRRHLSTRRRRLLTLVRGGVWLSVCVAVAYVGWFVVYLEPHRIVERLFIRSLVAELVKGSGLRNLRLFGQGIGHWETDPRERDRLKAELKRQFRR